MSVENVKKLLSKLETDETFKEKFIKSKLREEDNQESIMKVAESLGYPFSMEDYTIAKKEMTETELSDGDLERVAGGHASCFIFGYNPNDPGDQHYSPCYSAVK